MKGNIAAASVTLLLMAVGANTASAQQACTRRGVGSAYIDATTQANFVMETCDSAAAPIRMITVWTGVARPPQTTADARAANVAYREAVLALLKNELPGYVPGGMASAAGAWFLAVNRSGQTAVVFSDAHAQAHVLSRDDLPSGDSVLIVLLEHRALEPPVILGSEVVPGPLSLDRRVGSAERQTTQAAMVKAALARTRLWPRQEPM